MMIVQIYKENTIKYTRNYHVKQGISLKIQNMKIIDQLVIDYQTLFVLQIV